MTAGWLESGKLPGLVERSVRRALGSGAIQPIATQCVYLEDRGLPFVIRVVQSLKRKAVARRLQEDREARGLDVNPFLPYDERLHVADLSPSHVCLLNKFNVVRHHLLLVTRSFEDQQEPLNRSDFRALWSCLCEIGGLGFYNAGQQAGASQRHKHLQLVSLPLAPEGPPIPLEALLPGRSTRVNQVPGLPFRNAFGWLDLDPGGEPSGASQDLLRTYRRLAAQLSLEPSVSPYNLLVAPRWMMMVPRSRACFASISVNTLGFAGSILVKNSAELEEVREIGPMRILEQVAER